MNIFYLHPDPNKAAAYHYDKHKVKMILEAAQMLCTAHHHYAELYEYDGSYIPYKKAHYNHPSTQWVRGNAIQYQYAYDMFVALCDEYTYRYGRTHLTDEKLRGLLNQLPNNISLGQWSEPPQCMPDDVKVEGNSLNAYHKYYAKYKKDFAVWTKREVPTFMEQYA